MCEQLGVITALINYNLRLKSLVHCVNVANAKALVYGKGLAEGKERQSFLKNLGLI